MAMLAVGLLAACGDEEIKSEPNKKENAKLVKEEMIELEVSEIKVSFTNFTIEIEKAEIKDGKLILETRYNNDSFEGEKSFMASAHVEVKQSGEVLKETSGVETDKNSNYFYKNKVGINSPLEFNYKLKNQTDDIEVTFIPTDWDEESKSTIITIK